MLSLVASTQFQLHQESKKLPIHMTQRFVSYGLAVCLSLSMFTGQVDGHGSGIELTVQSGKLHTNANLYTTTFGNPVPFPPPATTQPGVSAISGISSSDRIFLETTGPLLFSAAAGVLVSTGTVDIQSPDLSTVYSISSSSGIQTGMPWLPLTTVIEDIHGIFTLPSIGTDSPGAYGLPLRFISPQFARSDPFLLVIGSHDFNPGLLNAAAAEMLAMLPPLCDFDGDLLCDIGDIDQLYSNGNLVTGVNSGPGSPMDLNGDLSLDNSDLNEWLILAGIENGFDSAFRRGDTDDIGPGFTRDVDITDFNHLASNFDPSGANSGTNMWRQGNFDGDQDIDITDFNWLAISFAPTGYGSSPKGTTVVVPEPLAVHLMLAALVLLALSNTKERKKDSSVS